jgi:hypothetical protein
VLANLSNALEAVVFEQLDSCAVKEPTMRVPARRDFGDCLDQATATTSDLLQRPPSRVRQGRADRSTLYTVNFSVGPFFGGTRTFGPAVLAVDTGALGLPQP